MSNGSVDHPHSLDDDMFAPQGRAASSPTPENPPYSELAPGKVESSAAGWKKHLKAWHAIVGAVGLYVAWVLVEPMFASNAPGMGPGQLQSIPPAVATAAPKPVQQATGPANTAPSTGGKARTPEARDVADRGGQGKEAMTEMDRDLAGNDDRSARPVSNAGRPTMREMELQAKVEVLEQQLQGQSDGQAAMAVAKLQQVHADLLAMSERIAKMEQNIGAVTQKAAASGNSAQPRAQAPTPKSKPAALEARASSAPKQPASRSGYKLNTVYANQAWIDQGDRTYIVQVGDRIGNARVTRIDPKERRVYTDAGVIQ
ncbi:hypothetical protein [Achromobacter insuavis]|uniref:hypothetical protein n=1 Tax=Achromobacter insuavis TaxID=1287735 RepID=UPI001F1354AC|nr:hypothetical protein [Achromobacter insuavis]